jgi:hypothetical protein
MEEVPKLTVEIDDRGFATPKRLALIGLLLVSAAFGAWVELEFEPGHVMGRVDSILDKLVGILIAVLVLTWCHFDALERCHFLGVGMRSLLFFLPFIGLPAYLFHSRGRGGFKAMGLAILFVGAMILAAVAGGGAAHVVSALVRPATFGTGSRS